MIRRRDDTRATRFPPGSLRLVALALAVGLLSACAFGDMDASRPCFSPDDCHFDDQCILGVCTAVPDFEVDVEIEPTSISGYLPLPVRAVDLASPGALEIIVPRPVVVRGEVKLENAPYAGAARISFSPEPSFRRSLRRSVDVLAGEEPDASFEVRLVGTMLDRGAWAAIPYSVGVRPLEVAHCCDEDHDLLCPAPRVMTGVRFETDQEGIVFAFPDRPTRILGRMMAGDTFPVPQSGVQVQAFGENPNVHSLPMVTDEDGRFCLALALPDHGEPMPVTLHAGPPPGAEGVAPNVTFSLLLTPGEIHRDVDLHLGAYGSPRPVIGRLVDRTGEAVEGVSLTFQGEVSSGGTYAAGVATDAYGAYAVDLLPGTYTVRAVPPRESRAGTVEIGQWVLEASREATAQRLDHTLPHRATLVGRVVGPDGDRVPLADLDVFADLVVPPGMETGGRHRRIGAVTDDQGDFELLLDPGEYRLLFRPPQTARLPWVVGPPVIVESGAHRDIGTVVLESASVFEGKALGQTEGGMTRPLAGAKVEIHARRHDDTFLLWEGRADDDGSFEVLLPTSLIGKVEPTGTREASGDDHR